MASPDQRGKRRRRRLRIAAGVLLLLVAAALIIARSGVLRVVVEQRLEAALSCDVTCRRAVVTWDGRLLATNVRLWTPDLEGRAGRFLEAERLVATVEPGSILSGLRFSHVRVIRPRLRVSQGADFSINIASLTWQDGGGAGGAMALPLVEFVEGVIELGEHGPEVEGGYHTLLELPVEGRLTPRTSNPGWLDVELRAAPGQSRSGEQLGSDTEAREVALTGWVDLEAGAGLLELGEVDLSFFGAHPAPSAILAMWRRMDLRGRLESAALVYAPETGVRARFRLDAVNLNVPLAGTGSRAAEDWAAMADVTGELVFGSDGLRADLHGRVEDLECGVALATQSLNLDAGFTCRVSARDLTIDSQPQFLAHTPEHVRTLFRRLSGPTAVVSGEVKIERAAADGDDNGRLDVQGELSFQHGAVSYAGFPYPVSEIEGHVRFDAERLDLLHMEGLGPSGAALQMTGYFAPLGPSSGFELHITGQDVPVDAHLLEALPDSSREAVEGLMDRSALEALERSGDVPPGFVPGGVVSIVTDVHRPEHGHVDDTTFDVRIQLDRAGVLPSVLPLPMTFQDARLRVRGGVVTVEAGHFTTASGGRVEIGGSYHLPMEGDGEDVRMELRGEGIRVDRSLLRALELTESRFEGSGMPRVSDLVRGLGLEGQVRFDAEATPDGFSCAIPLGGMTVEGVSGPLTDLSGMLRVTDRGVSLESLEGVLYGARLQLDLLAGVGGEDVGWEAKGRLADLDLTRRIEGLLGVLGETFAAYESALESLRGRLAPSGVVDVSFVARGDARGTGDVNISVDAMRDAGFDTVLGRLSARDLQGDLHYDGRVVRLDGVEGHVGLEGNVAGRVRLSGEVSTVSPASDLDIALEGFRFDAPLVREVLRVRAGGLMAAITEADPRGEFDGRIRRVVDEEGMETVTPELRPRSLSFDVAGTTVSLDQMSGVVRMSDGLVELEDVRGTSAHWRLGCEGRLGVADGELGLAELTVDAEGTRFDPPMRALLPTRARDVLTALNLDVEGGFRMEDARVGLRPGDEGERVEVDATITFQGGRIGVALPVDEMDGALTVRRHRGADGEERTEVFVTAERLRVGGEKGIPLTDGRLRLQSTSWGWVLPLAQARLGDGMVAGEGILREGSEAGSTYAWNLTLTGLPLSGLIRNQGSESGRVDGVVDISGVLGEASTVRGRGSLELRDGDLLAGTGLTPLLELTSLTLPTGERIDTGVVEFHVSGARAMVDLLELSPGRGGSIVVRGIGSMNWRNLELDLRFSSRQRKRVPGLSDVFESVRDELVTAVVRGRLTEPTIEFESLRATRQLWDAIFGDSDSRKRGGRSRSGDQEER